MNPRATLALALAAGLPSAVLAQDVMLTHYSWFEAQALTNQPATGPLAGNSIIDPGEGARFRLGVTALINGANAVGQTITYTNPSPGGIGTVRGLGSVVYDFMGDNNSSSAHGEWRWLQWGGAPWGQANSPPYTFPGGAGVVGGGSQFISPGGTANPVNNNQAIVFGTWTPSSYAHRVVHWIARPSVMVPSGQHNSVLLSYGIGTAIDPTTGQPINFDQLVGKYIGSNFGEGLNIPIAPAPATLALLSLGSLMIRPRRPSP